jgi:hypothetical protein|tara:strand:+ start:61 stop:246 length:186 start_codon:yes stop_codon:yes gene_type:complete
MDVEQQQLYLSKSLREWLKTAAKEERRSVSSLAENLLREGLERHYNGQKSQINKLTELARR